MNKVFDSGTIDGYTVAAIDGIKLFGSYKKCCSECLTSTKNEKTYFYHYSSVMAVIGNGPKLILAFRSANQEKIIQRMKGS